jgi:hypothetical protein
MATGYGLDGRGSIPGRSKNFSLLNSVHTGSGVTQPPIQWASSGLSLREKRPGCVVDHSPPTCAEVKKGGAVPPFPRTPSWRSAPLITQRGNFILPFLLLDCFETDTDCEHFVRGESLNLALCILPSKIIYKITLCFLEVIFLLPPLLLPWRITFCCLFPFRINS